MQPCLALERFAALNGDRTPAFGFGKQHHCTYDFRVIVLGYHALLGFLERELIVFGAEEILCPGLQVPFAQRLRRDKFGARWIIRSFVVRLALHFPVDAAGNFVVLFALFVHIVAVDKVWLVDVIGPVLVPQVGRALPVLIRQQTQVAHHIVDVLAIVPAKLLKVGLRHARIKRGDKRRVKLGCAIGAVSGACLSSVIRAHCILPCAASFAGL